MVNGETHSNINSISGLALSYCDLSVARALEFIDEPARHNYEIMYQWFMEGTDEPAGSRLYGKRIPGVDDHFAHCAQRGIHVPANHKYAASIYISNNSKYATTGLDGIRLDLPDGTWLLYYVEHRKKPGSALDTSWMNQGLISCMQDGVPVGVFIQKGKSSKYYRSLAYVESWDPDQGLFVLHGPVTEASTASFAAPQYEVTTPQDEVVYEYVMLPKADELLVDNREFKKTKIAARKGQQKFRAELLKAYNGRCAICGGTSVPTLQGAHIIDHRGESANIVQNGLLLRADIHILYDSFNLSIEPETHRIILADSLASTEYAKLFDGDHERRLALPQDKLLCPNDEYLNVHHQRFLARQIA